MNSELIESAKQEIMREINAGGIINSGTSIFVHNGKNYAIKQGQLDKTKYRLFEYDYENKTLGKFLQEFTVNQSGGSRKSRKVCKSRKARKSRRMRRRNTRKH